MVSGQITKTHFLKDSRNLIQPEVDPIARVGFQMAEELMSIDTLDTRYEIADVEWILN